MALQLFNRTRWFLACRTRIQYFLQRIRIISVTTDIFYILYIYIHFSYIFIFHAYLIYKYLFFISNWSRIRCFSAEPDPGGKFPDPHHCFPSIWELAFHCCLVRHLGVVHEALSVLGPCKQRVCQRIQTLTLKGWIKLSFLDTLLTINSFNLLHKNGFGCNYSTLFIKGVILNVCQLWNSNIIQ